MSIHSSPACQLRVFGVIPISSSLASLCCPHLRYYPCGKTSQIINPKVFLLIGLSAVAASQGPVSLLSLHFQVGREQRSQIQKQHLIHTIIAMILPSPSTTSPLTLLTQSIRPSPFERRQKTHILQNKVSRHMKLRAHSDNVESTIRTLRRIYVYIAGR